MTWHLRFTTARHWDIGVGRRQTPRGSLPWAYRVWNQDRCVGGAVFLGPRLGLHWVWP